MSHVLLLATLAAIAACSWWAWYRISVRLHPYAPCRRCQGRRGRNRGSTARRWGNCPRCGGSGRRRRLGAGREQ